MASYNDFLNAAKKAGVMDRFTESDLTTAEKNPEYGISMIGLLKDIGKASNEEQRLIATEAANKLRKSYGIYDSGGSYASSYGSAINGLMDQVNNYGSFSYGNQKAYQQLLDQAANYGSFSYGNQKAYQQLLDQAANYGPYEYGNQGAYQQALDSVMNPTPFNYDAASDPSFSAYKKAYLREGDRASANVLAQTAAASGGRASSYAQTAAQQAGNYYAGQLSDIIPTLEQNAYSRYLDEVNSRLNQLAAIQSDRAFDYQGYLDRFSQLQSSLGAMQSDRAFDYQNYLDRFSQLQSSLGAMQSDRAFDYEQWANEYNMLQNSLANLQAQDATEYQRYLEAQDRTYRDQQAQLDREQIEHENQQNAQQLAYENALALYQLLGYATPEVAKILGISSGSSSGYTGSSGSGSSSGGKGSSKGGGTGYDNGGLSNTQIKELQKALGVDADGKYGPASKRAAGGLSAKEAYAKYVTGGGSPENAGATAEDASSAAGGGVDTGLLTNEELVYYNKLLARARNKANSGR